MFFVKTKGRIINLSAYEGVKVQESGVQYGLYAFRNDFMDTNLAASMDQLKAETPKNVLLSSYKTIEEAEEALMELYKNIHAKEPGWIAE